MDCGPLLSGPPYGRPPHREDGPPHHEDGPPPHEGHDEHHGHGRPGPSGPVSTAETVGDPITVAPGDEGTIFATCPAGSTLVSGGYLMSGTMQVLLTSRAATPDTWTVTVLNTSTESATVAAVVQCAP